MQGPEVSLVLWPSWPKGSQCAGVDTLGPGADRAIYILWVSVCVRLSMCVCKRGACLRCYGYSNSLKNVCYLISVYFCTYVYVCI